MKTRIVSALVGIVVLFGILFCPLMWVFSVAASLLAMIAVWELLNNTGLNSHKWFTLCSMLFAGAEVLACSWIYERYTHNYMMNPPLALWFGVTNWIPLILVGVYVLLALVLLAVYRRSFVWKSFALTLYAALGFVSLASLRVVGLSYVLLPLVISWMSDTGAYFTGVFFGKHKMAPVISPKKTWEGFFGGWVISVGLTVLYGVICNAVMGAQGFNLIMLAVMSAVLAPLSVVGDLLASLIKRRTGIKDYGNIMPGHGGVMDRFDSVVFIAPMVLATLWIYLMLY